MQQPDSFLIVRVHELSWQVPLSGLCVGYELGKWRSSQFAQHVMNWLPEFALTAEECLSIGHHNSVKFLRMAAERVYKTEKFKNRGEFGELFLHIAIRQVYGSLPAVSKIFYKSAKNDTVKGFDCVHVVGAPEGLELWLGEAKFYSDLSDAIRDVTSELKRHVEADYLRDEFSLIVNKIDDSWPHAPILRRLLQPETSLDEVFKKVRIPVLLTYDSDCVQGHTSSDQAYTDAFSSEVTAGHKAFVAKGLPAVELVLFLIPLHTKSELLKHLDEGLRKWQNI
jgi:hypothetical protein